MTLNDRVTLFRGVHENLPLFTVIDRECPHPRGMNKKTDQHLLTVEQVAEICAISPQTVRRWLRLGHLRAVKLSPGRRNGCVRVREADLATFIERGIRENCDD